MLNFDHKIEIPFRLTSASSFLGRHQTKSSEYHITKI
jgi:hypothetical protein